MTHRLHGCAIVRALAIEPKLMLFDEPTSALDLKLVGEVLATMRNLADQGLTLIVATHEIGFAREAAEHLFQVAETLPLIEKECYASSTSSQAAYSWP